MNLKLATALLATAIATPALADPVQFTFTGIVANSSNPLVNVGDTLTLILDADNGGSSLANQTWDYADLQGFSVSVGGYSATYSKAFEFPATDNFTTDAAGNVTTAQFYGTSEDSANTDNFGSSIGDIVFGNAQFYDTQLTTNFQLTTLFTDPAQWTVAFADSSVPEPATWGLMILGFGAVGGAMRRRSAPVAYAA